MNEFSEIVNALSSVEIEFDDEIRALILLASLPNSWEIVKTAVSNSAGKEKLKFNDIRDCLENGWVIDNEDLVKRFVIWDAKLSGTVYDRLTESVVSRSITQPFGTMNLDKVWVFDRSICGFRTRAMMDDFREIDTIKEKNGGFCCVL